RRARGEQSTLRFAKYLGYKHDQSNARSVSVLNRWSCYVGGMSVLWKQRSNGQFAVRWLLHGRVSTGVEFHLPRHQLHCQCVYHEHRRWEGYYLPGSVRKFSRVESLDNLRHKMCRIDDL